MVDWAALGQVAITTLIGTIVIVSLASLGIKLLDQAETVTPDGLRNPNAGVWKALAYLTFAIVVVLVAYGFYLLIPYFH